MTKPAKFQKGRRKSNVEYNQELNEYNKKQSKKPLSEQVKKALKEKAATSKYSYSDLVKVFKRGQSAYLSSGSRNVSMYAWSMARVNKFLKGHGISDKDIYSKNKKSEKRKFSPGQLFIYEYLRKNKTNNISKAWKEWKKLENKSKYIKM